MLAVFLQTLPFFALIGLGFGAAKRGFFSDQAAAALTRFVFYFALSAMLLRFSSRLDLAAVYDTSLVLAYLAGTTAVYLAGFGVAMLRSRGLEEAAVEGQCAAIGNTGFLGVPMLTTIFGEAAIGPDSDEEAHRMEALETRLLAELGIADPYAPESADS